MKTIESFVQISNDVDGNPRFIMSWTGLGFNSYITALCVMRQIGGKEFIAQFEHGRGIVFTSYNIQVTCNLVNTISSKFHAKISELIER